MANQEENYTKIANDILEYSPKLKLNGTQRGIIEVIWRYTYGFHRDDHDFSLGFLAEATNCNRQQVKRELDKLLKDEVLYITKAANFNTSRRIAFNKNFSKLKDNAIVSAKKSTVSELEYTTVSGLADTTVSGLEYQERKTKENIKKELPSYDIHFEELWKLFPNKKGKSAVTTKSKKMLEKVGRDDLVKAITKYSNEVRDVDKKFIMYGSTFFNGRYDEYLDKEDDQEEQEDIDLKPKQNDSSIWTD